jgi:CheY-like chemotaxis protein
VKLIILYVDDERAILNLFKQMVSPRHEVILAHNGEEALEHLLSDEEIDVCLLDMMLGAGPSGFEVLRRIREEAPARLERLIVVTGARGIPGVDEHLEDYRVPTTGKAIPVIEKPFDVVKLERRLAEYGVSPAPRGPRYPARRHFADVAPPRKPHQSKPQLPEYDAEEITAVTAIAESDDGRLSPLAKRTNENRATIAEHDRTLKEHHEDLEELKGHFASPKPGSERGGMVYEHIKEWNATKSWIKSIPVVVAVVGAIIGGVIWISAHTQPPPPPPVVDHAALAREMAKIQAQQR